MSTKNINAFNFDELNSEELKELKPEEQLLIKGGIGTRYPIPPFPPSGDPGGRGRGTGRR